MDTNSELHFANKKLGHDERQVRALERIVEIMESMDVQLRELVEQGSKKP